MEPKSQQRKTVPEKTFSDEIRDGERKLCGHIAECDCQMGVAAPSEPGESAEQNAVYKELRQIYCCKGAEFARPTLEKAWKEISRLSAQLQERDTSIQELVDLNNKLAALNVQMHTRIQRLREAMNAALTRHDEKYGVYNHHDLITSCRCDGGGEMRMRTATVVFLATGAISCYVLVSQDNMNILGRILFGGMAYICALLAGISLNDPSK